MDSRPEIYNATEKQLELVNASVSSWRCTTFWALMYMQSFLFDACNIEAIGQELATQPAQYEHIFSYYYGENFASNCNLYSEDEDGYFSSYLLELKAGHSPQAIEIKQQWLENVKGVAEEFCKRNPYWSGEIMHSMMAHFTELLCASAEDDMLGKYQHIGMHYLVLDRLAEELGLYIALGIIRQFGVI